MLMRFWKYFDSAWYADSRVKMAWFSFIAGVAIAVWCLFGVEPYGEISTSGISIVSELLILAGAMLGVYVAFDIKAQKMIAIFEERLSKKEDKKEETK